MKNNDKKNKQSKELKFLINKLYEAKKYVEIGYTGTAIGILQTLIDLLKED